METLTEKEKGSPKKNSQQLKHEELTKEDKRKIMLNAMLAHSAKCSICKTKLLEIRDHSIKEYENGLKRADFFSNMAYYLFLAYRKQKKETKQK